MPNGTSKAEMDYKAYIRETGKCPVCDIPMAIHAQCESCLIMCGEKHEYTMETFRNHQLCTPCIGSWNRYDSIAGRSTTWWEFLKPSSNIPWRNYEKVAA